MVGSVTAQVIIVQEKMLPILCIEIYLQVSGGLVHMLKNVVAPKGAYFSNFEKKVI